VPNQVSDEESVIDSMCTRPNVTDSSTDRSRPFHVLVSGEAFYEHPATIARGCKAAGLDATAHTYLTGHDGTPFSVACHYISKLPGIGRRSPAHGYCDSLLEAVRSARPDVLLLIKGNLLQEGVLPRVRDACPGIRIVLWALDSMENIKLYDGIARDVDALALFEESDIDDPRVSEFSDVFVLPMGFSPEVYFPARKEPKYDVMFCGSPDGERLALLHRLAEESEAHGWRLGIVSILHRGLPFARWRLAQRSPLLAKYLVARSASPAEANAYYNESIAVVNVHKPQSVVGFNPRTVEVLAAGACELLDHREALEKTFPDRECVLYYDDLDELVERIAELLADPALQQRLRENGPRYAGEHSFEVRMRMLASWIDKGPSGGTR
jgi:glycosyltransferase involved in cell wall biosynthesis